MLEVLSLPFMQRAIIAGIIVGFLGSFYGIFVVQRKMSFLGDGLAHSAFGGVALGLLLQVEPLWIALPATILVSLAISIIKDKTKLEMDTSIGIFFALSMAIGIVLISMKNIYTVDAYTYLFGSILSVRASDLYISSVVMIFTLLIMKKYWKRWAYATFDSELAKSDKIPVRRDDYLLSILIAITIVVSIKLVGIVLIASFLVIPAASARIMSRTFFQMSYLSIIIGISTAIIGLIVSILTDLPSGATIILVQALLFFVFIFWKR